MNEKFDRFQLDDLIAKITRQIGGKPETIYLTKKQLEELEESIFLIGNMAGHILKVDGINIVVKERSPETKLNYYELTDAEIDKLMATRVREWFIEKHKVLCYASEQEGVIMPMHRWHPSSDINQVWKCEEAIAKKGLTIRYCYLLAMEINSENEFYFIHSSARERCIAMLKTIENR